MKLFKQLKITGITMLIVALFTVSCEKTSQEKIEGKWTFSSATYDVKVGDMSLVEYFMEYFQISETEAKVYASAFTMDDEFSGSIEFKNDGTYTSIDDEGESTSGTWEISEDGKKLTITEHDETLDLDFEIVMDIVSLDKKEMKLKFVETYDEDLDGDEVDDTLTITIEINLSK